MTLINEQQKNHNQHTSWLEKFLFYKNPMKAVVVFLQRQLDKKYQEQIQTLKEEKQTEIDKYQEKYLELLNKMQAK